MIKTPQHELGAFLRADRELRRDRPIRNAKLVADHPLGEPVNEAEGHDLAATIRQGLDGFGQEGEFLVAGDVVGNAGMLVQDV